ncbi:MAG: hypothetical protein ABI277_18485 [Burkholderiaceae bacterium]
MSSAGVKVLTDPDAATIKTLPAEGACLGWHAVDKRVVGPAYHSPFEAKILAAWVLAGAPAN